MPVQGSPALRLGLCTFGILALELAIIRWLGGQIRILAYFQNLVLLATFLGMGLGVALGRRRPRLFQFCLPALMVLSALLAFAEPLGLMRVHFPDPTLMLWGAETQSGLLPFIGVTLMIVTIFWLVAAVFLLAGIQVGWLFLEMAPLKAYVADIIGSFLGVVAITAVAALGTPPYVWLLLGAVPLLVLAYRHWSMVALAVVIVMALLSEDNARFSPYNRIDITRLSEMSEKGREDEWRVSVNRDFHQDIRNLSEQAIAENPIGGYRRFLQRVYELPFSVHGKGGNALIVGAGTGTDVMAALRRGYSDVHSVEIDHEILRIGAELHPEKPYSDPRVIPIINDARAFFQQNPDRRFDVVCYGLLDSHSMFSSMSSLRLESYVYTVEGIRAGWEHVKEDGLLSIAFSVNAGPWLADRLLGIIREATGREPIIVAHGIYGGLTYLVSRELDPTRIPTDLAPVLTEVEVQSTKLPTDDWPFLYLRPDSVPYAYLAVLFAILLTSTLAVRGVYGRRLFSSRRFDVPMFLLGAGFMLVETRMITELSLLFGSTWIVNASVIAGVLLMVIAGSLLVAWRTPRRVLPWYGPLFLSLILTWVVGAGVLNRFDLWPRLILAGSVYATPVFFAAIIFACLLRRSSDASASLGCNLIGAVLGGLLEYSSMLLGLRAMTLLAVLLYLGSIVALTVFRDPVGRTQLLDPKS